MSKLSIPLIALFLLLASLTTAQNFESNFLGDDFMFYKGVLFKMNNEAIGGFSNTFYSDLEHMQSDYDNNVLYPGTEYNFVTEKDSLINRVFKVEDIIDKTGAAYNGKPYSIEKPIFVLQDILT